MVELITLREYARRRGCTEGAVRKAVRTGRIALIDGKIDPVAADAQWARNSRRRVNSRPSERQGDQAAQKHSSWDGLMEDRARRERAEADMAELRAAELRRELVRESEVRASISRRLVALRESILQIPARLAPVLAAESDPMRCQECLQAELVQALEHTVAL